jgi:hypothetical protein
MKHKLSMLFTVSVLLIHIASCGQNRNTPNQPKNKIPVALGKIYQLPQETDGVVPNTNPTLSKSVMNDYITYIEWHFEMKFTAEERKEYENIIVDMWNNNEKDRADIKNTALYTQELRKKDWYTLFSEHSGKVNGEIMDLGMEGLLSTWNPTTVRGRVKKGAQTGDKESVFLWNKITEYESPIAEGKVFVSKFTQKYVDATAEWMAYKMNVVANKEFIVLDEEKREQMKKMILNAWNKEQSEKKQPYDYGNVEGMLMQATTNWNTHRLTKKYSLDSYITNYNKLYTLAEWAKEVVYYCPDLKPYAEQRLKELNDYAAKMSDAEWQLEFQRLKMQADMSKQAFQEMKNQMVKSHVLSLNILEGYDKWEVKETIRY